MECVLLISFRFNPGHFSHLAANYRLVEDIGLRPVLLVNKRFNQMDARNIFQKINDVRCLKEGTIVRSAVIWFPSIENTWRLLRLKIEFNAKVTYVYHEPFESISAYLKSGFGIVKVAKIVSVHAVNLVVLALSDHVVLPSRKAYDIYHRKYRWLNPKYSRIPLLFDDEAAQIKPVEQKKWIGYIGTIAADHAFNCFLDFAETAIEKHWLSGYSFVIASPSKIPEASKERVAVLAGTNRLQVVCGSPLGTDEINFYYNGCLIVWNAYNRSTQSGVLPKAYMFGAAVLSSKSSATEFVDDFATGRILSSNRDASEIKNAIEEIVSRGAEYSLACRRKFLTTFFYRNAIESFRAIL